MLRFKDFTDLIDRMSSTSPERTALLVCDAEGAGAGRGVATDMTRAVTWAELVTRVRERADELESGGCACEAILADGTVACVVEVFAAVRAGLQVALVDPLMPNQVLAPLLREVDADCVWASNCARQQELEGFLAPGATPACGAHAVLFFTSGTTSSSKAVVLTDESLMSSAFNGSSLMPLTPDDTLLCLLPLSHVFGFVCGLLWGLSCGATVALGRGPRHYADDFALFSPTVVSVVPKLLEYLVARGVLGEKLRLVLVGAADCPDTLLDVVRGSGIRVSLGYGLTETSSGVALSTGDNFHAMTICPEDEVRIADDGEILVSAPTCLMKGYYRDADKTAAAVRDGVLHTGDRGRLDGAGLLHVEGRLKDVLTLSGGTKVFLPEYEAAIAAALGERDIAVLLHRGRLTLVCGQLSREFASDEILKQVDAALTAYPPASRVGCVMHLGHALPRTAAGDVERWKIQEELEDDNC